MKMEDMKLLKILKNGIPDVLEEIKESNIRGRGGAGFPRYKMGNVIEDQERAGY